MGYSAQCTVHRTVLLRPRCVDFRFVDDVISARNQPGNGDNSKASTQSDSPGGNTGPERESGVDDCRVYISIICMRVSTFSEYRRKYVA